MPSIEQERSLLAFYKKYNPALVNRVPEIIAQLGGDSHSLARGVSPYIVD
jgi:hypothetical protein